MLKQQKTNPASGNPAAFRAGVLAALLAGAPAWPQDKGTLDPKPRDFRKGIFKFTGVKDKARPRREDIVGKDDGWDVALAGFARAVSARVG